jgi:hypothetical protein
MDLNSFYLFGSGSSKTPVTVSSDDLVYETSREMARGNFSSVELPISFNQVSGKKWTDLLNPSSVGLYLVSSKFADLLDKNNISGWKSFPIVLKNKEGEIVTGYSGFSVIGESGPPDFSKCEVFEKQLVPDGRRTRYYKGLYIGLEEWDGSDFFVPRNTLFIVITARVKLLLEQASITNVVFQNLAEFDIAEYALPKT